MSVSGPGDGGYQYYHQQVDDLEEELRAQARKARERSDEAEESSARKSEANQRRQEESAAEAIRVAKEKANEAVSYERQNSRAEVERLKRQAYDRFGRYNGEEADVLKQQLADTTQAMKVEQDKSRRAARDTEAAYDQKAQDKSTAHAAELERVAQEAHDSATSTYEQTYSEHKDAFNELRDAGARKYEDAQRERMDEQNIIRRDAARAIAEARAEYERSARKSGESNDTRFERNAKEYARVREQDARDMRDAHDAETRQLRDQVKEMNVFTGEYAKGRAEGARDAIQAYENENRDQSRVTVSAYEKQIDGLNHKAKETDRYFGALNNQSLKDKDNYFAGVIRKQNQEARFQQQDLQRTFNKAEIELNTRNRRDKEHADLVLERQGERANESRSQALEQQAESYQKAIGDVRAADDETIRRLQADIRTKATSEDTNDISPAAEAAVRRSVEREHGKVMDADQKRAQGAIDSLQREYAERLSRTVEDSNHARTVQSRQLTAERQMEKTDLLAHIDDAELRHQESSRAAQQEQTRMSDNLQRVFAENLEKQRRQYEEMIETQRDEASTRVQAQRQEAEFKYRMAQRAFAARENELIRDYEKKLSDQRVDAKASIEEIKADSEKQIRDAERKSKVALDEQARSYEQRLTQAEVQHQERERYVTQNYQDELERMKRTHAALIQKKS
jgi:hypothetical protein